MLKIEERIRNCFKQACLNGYYLDWDKFKIEDNYERNGNLYKCYRYRVTFPQSFCINKRDKWDTSDLNNKIDDLNSLFQKQIQMCIVHLNPLSCIPYESGTDLVVLYLKVQ